jgi:arsenate reductase-like glutaredoxin family protein
MIIDHNMGWVLSGFSTLQAKIQEFGMNDPRVYRSLLFMNRQLQVRPHHYLKEGDELAQIYAWFKSVEVQQILNAAREWEKKDNEINRERNRQKAMQGRKRFKQAPSKPTKSAILGKNGVLSIGQAKPISRDTARAVGLPYRKH